MKTQIALTRLGGIMNLLAAALHFSFWGLFNWDLELAKLNVVNSNVMQMLNLFIIVFFVYTGLLLLWKPKKVITSMMGRQFLGMLTTMWTARLIMEFYFPEGDLVFTAILGVTIFFFLYPLLSSLKVQNKIDSSEHMKHAWKAQKLLSDFEIEDVWELPVEMNQYQYVGDMQKVFGRVIDEIGKSGIAGLLFKFRFFLGRVFGWDNEVDTIDILPAGSIRERYAQQNGLNVGDFTVQQGAQFVPVYHLKNEALSEIENATVHAAVHYGKVPLGNAKYGVHMTVYVKPKGLFGKVYMQLIKPFRLYIVYPIMLRAIGTHWQAYQQARSEEFLMSDKLKMV